MTLRDNSGALPDVFYEIPLHNLQGYIVSMTLAMYHHQMIINLEKFFKILKYLGRKAYDSSRYRDLDPLIFLNVS